MHIHRSAVELVVQAPAKLNLWFEVLAKRRDGYHEIETLMCPIDLCDALYFQDVPGEKNAFFDENSAKAIQFQCRPVFGAGGPASRGLHDVPNDAKNLVVRAVELARRRAGVNHGAKLLLIKRIPSAAGLGGGSSDAAAALVAANECWQLGRSQEELSAWAAELGSDVPFFLANGPAICRGRGELVEPVEGLGRLHFVVIYPPAGLATAAVYGACHPTGRAQPIKPLVTALQQGNWSEAGRRFLNRLQPAAESLSPWVSKLRKAFSQQDCLGHGMSGSGSAYFGFYRHARHARRSARLLQAKGLGAVFTVQSCR